MPVSKKYKGNRNHRKKRNSRKLKRAGQGERQPLMSYVNIEKQQFNHSENYNITRNAVSGIIGEKNIDAWNNELNNPKFKQNIYGKENPKDMFLYFPEAMHNAGHQFVINLYYRLLHYRGLKNTKIWTDIYATENYGHKREREGKDDYYVFLNKRHEINKKLEEKQNLEDESLNELIENKNTNNLPTETKYNDIVNKNGEFINENTDINGYLIKEFRENFGIMVGNDKEVEEDRELYVKSLLWAYSFNPEKYLPDNSNRRFKTFTNIGSSNRYDKQEEYKQDKKEYQEYLDNQVNYGNMTKERADELMNQWTQKNKGTYWGSKYNPLRQNSAASAAGGRKTRKRRKIKKRKGRKSRKASKKNA